MKANFLSYIQTAIGMLSKSMHKLFSDFTRAVKLILQACQSHLPSVLRQTCAQTHKEVFKSRLSMLLLDSCCLHCSWLPGNNSSLRSELSVIFASGRILLAGSWIWFNIAKTAILMLWISGVLCY